MSADNGVYIGIFPTANGDKEYRVTHAQAIDNVECDEYVRGYFENAECFQSIADAVTRAQAIEAEILNDPICPICEYGVCVLPEFRQALKDYPEPSR